MLYWFVINEPWSFFCKAGDTHTNRCRPSGLNSCVALSLFLWPVLSLLKHRSLLPCHTQSAVSVSIGWEGVSVIKLWSHSKKTGIQQRGWKTEERSSIKSESVLRSNSWGLKNNMLRCYGQEISPACKSTCCRKWSFLHLCFWNTVVTIFQWACRWIWKHFEQSQWQNKSKHFFHKEQYPFPNFSN